MTQPTGLAYTAPPGMSSNPPPVPPGPAAPAKPAPAPTTPSGTTPHQSLMIVAGEITAVCILSLLSGVSREMETLVMALLIGLWLVFLVNKGPDLFNRLKIRK